MRFKFFLLEYISPSEANYATEAIAIAQGMKKAGEVFYANIDYWFDPVEKEFLFKKAPADFDADFHVYYDSFYFSKNLDRFKEVDYSKVNVLIDRNDELHPLWQYPEYSDFHKFDLLLVDHYNIYQHYLHGLNVKPWQIGFTNRVVDYNEKFKRNKVEEIVLDTYRLPHNLRLLAINKLSPALDDLYPTRRVITDKLEDTDVNLNEQDKEYWKTTGKRHNPLYFDQLNSALLTYVFGGFYHLNPPAFNFTDKILRRVNKMRSRLGSALGKDIGKYYFIYQWDSYRLWEALMANTCPITMDFEYWGFSLPVMPVNWEHYIGVKGFDFETTIRRIRDMPTEEIIRIGQSGKQWAQENYGQEAVARRFINEVKQLRK